MVKAAFSRVLGAKLFSSVIVFYNVARYSMKLGVLLQMCWCARGFPILGRLLGRPTVRTAISARAAWAVGPNQLPPALFDF